MGLSAGWLLLLGGCLGAVRTSTAKTFSWANDVDIHIANEEREHPMTRGKRSVLVILCLTAAIIGAVMIQRRHEWNPFKPTTTLQDDNVVVGRFRLAPQAICRLLSRAT